jgi:cation/acetate symporter
VALLMAPHLRAMGCTPCPTFLPGALWRALAALHCGAGGGAVLVHLRGGADLRRGPDRFAPDRGAVRDRHLLGLGGVLLCSFLGGMRAITWTQVAQYVVLLLAFLIPVSWLAYKQLGNPLARWCTAADCPRSPSWSAS